MPVYYFVPNDVFKLAFVTYIKNQSNISTIIFFFLKLSFNIILT